MRRPRIPEQTQRELWARAAGRCEFRGCNSLLYKDELTQQRSNLATISHIVAYSPKGPRGHPTRSKLLETDICNLMLTCNDHGKVVDDPTRIAEYPEELLLEFKHEHEQRIRMLTEIQEDAQTHVLLLQASIDERRFEIDERDAFRAILPKYPAEEHAMVIDLSGLTSPSLTDGFFSVTAASITSKVERYLDRRAGRSSIKTLSIFALAPVPLLVHLGYLLGDITHVDLYQRHRSLQNWNWGEDEAVDEFYETIRPHEPTDPDSDQPIALILSVSACISHAEVSTTLGEEPRIYEIRACEPGLDYLRSRKRLEVFGYESRKLLEDIRMHHDRHAEIHLFAAIPAPLAIEFGRNLKQYHPPFKIYEYHKAERSYVHAMTINTAQSV